MDPNTKERRKKKFEGVKEEGENDDISPRTELKNITVEKIGVWIVEYVLERRSGSTFVANL